MGTRVNIPSMDAISYCSNKDPMLSVAEVICGCPVTVDPHKNPFQKRPEDLSGRHQFHGDENTWYLVLSDQIGDSEAGFWIAKGEPRPMIFPNSPIICWEITRVFCKRNYQETDWMMLEYNIPITNGTFSICKIWQDPNNHVQDTGIMPESDVFSGGDFLELLDLEDPLFPSVD